MYLPKRYENILSTKTCTQMFIAALFIIAKNFGTAHMFINRKTYTNCVIFIQWNKTQQQKKNELLIHITTWMNFKNIMLKKILTPNRTEYMIPFIWNSRTGKSNLWWRKKSEQRLLEAGKGRDWPGNGDGTVCIFIGVGFHSSIC